METLVLLAVGVVALGALVYWWLRPVTWQDAEGTFDDNTNPLMDTDTGSLAWFFRHRTEEGRFLGFTLGLRDWWENERRRWRR